ncbi:MAG: DUF1998 domain-containing protein, partial [Deltaproteobacteria bacterium]|nr:DUF1998 domain-containing protein [Deltaproteobacteria bacterium]
KGFDFVEAIAKAALELVQGCACKSGCPACVGSWSQNRFLVAWGLQNLWTETALPAGLGDAAARSPIALPAVARLAWPELAQHWDLVVARMQKYRAFGAEVLATAVGAEVRGDRLVLTVQSVGLADWIGRGETRARLETALRRFVEAPAGSFVELMVSAPDRERALHRQIKLQRRHDDLVETPAVDERAANATLASGYVLAKADGSVN